MTKQKHASFGFTMAEILLSLTIIGVVAAITLPSLTGNINERTWNTQRKALYARMSQAIALMPALNGYGKYAGTNTDDIVTVTDDTAAETFVTAGLSKVLKINNICDNTQLADCGLPSKINPLGGGTAVDFPTKLSELNPMFTSTYTAQDAPDYPYRNPQKDIDTKVAAFETANGESIATFYNPQCKADSTFSSMDAHVYTQPLMCANFIYDLNGSKGPNTVGKDIGFMSVLYSTDSVVVAPIPLQKDFEGAYQQNASKKCTSSDNESRLPNKEELASMFYNSRLIGATSVGGYADTFYWSSDTIYVDNAIRGIRLKFTYGAWTTSIRESSLAIRCIKR